ncbi:MAG: AraC family transcriptional regulator [Bacteroidota bacterium]
MILNYESHKLGDFSVFERVTFSPPFKPSITYHNEACFIYSVNGSGISYGGVKRDAIETGESILMKCGSFLNHWKASPRSSTPYKVIAIHITPDIVKRIFKNKIPDFLYKADNTTTTVFQKIPQQQIVDEYIRGLTFYLDHPDLINEDLIALKVKELILLLHKIDHNELREILGTLFNPVALNFKSIIEAHLFEDLELKDYAALTNTSLSTFKRTFKKLFNASPARYISNKRLEKAAQLLKLSDLRISDICFECGFKNLSTFSKSFSLKYQMTPSAYRIAN